MFLFTDFLEMIRKEINAEIPEVTTEDLTVGQVEHGDISAKLIRYLINRKDAKTASDKILERVRILEFVSDASFTNNYLNVWIRPEHLFRAMKESIDSTGMFPDVFQEPERVSVEHTSTNPTGPLHIGRARNSVIGDSLARLKKRVGYRVTTQYYVNDSGKQMMSLYFGHEKFHKGEKSTIPLLLDGYIMTYKYFEETGSEKDVEELMERYERNDSDLISKVRAVAGIMLEGISADLATIGIKIDEYTWESEFISTGETGVVMERLSENLQEENGARFVDIPGLRKIYLQRRNGTSLYITRDIAYHMYKFSQYDHCIVVVGEDHREHGKIMKYIMNDLLEYANSLSFVYYAYVNLETGKMSTRKGTSIPMITVYEKLKEKSMEELQKRYGENADIKTAEKIAASSFRYHLLKFNPTKPVTFRWEDALDFNGDTAVSIMYSTVRASSILNKVSSEGATLDSENFPESEKNLLLLSYIYPYKLMDAAKSDKPEIIANFAFMLSNAFTRFYEDVKISEQPPEIKNRQLETIKIFRTIIEDACEIIGIQKVEKL